MEQPALHAHAATRCAAHSAVTIGAHAAAHIVRPTEAKRVHWWHADARTRRHAIDGGIRGLVSRTVSQIADLAAQADELVRIKRRCAPNPHWWLWLVLPT